MDPSLPTIVVLFVTGKCAPARPTVTTEDTSFVISLISDTQNTVLSTYMSVLICTGSYDDRTDLVSTKERKLSTANVNLCQRSSFFFCLFFRLVFGVDAAEKLPSTVRTELFREVPRRRQPSSLVLVVGSILFGGEVAKKKGEESPHWCSVDEVVVQVNVLVVYWFDHYYFTIDTKGYPFAHHHHHPPFEKETIIFFFQIFLEAKQSGPGKNFSFWKPNKIFWSLLCTATTDCILQEWQHSVRIMPQLLPWWLRPTSLVLDVNEVPTRRLVSYEDCYTLRRRHRQHQHQHQRHHIGERTNPTRLSWLRLRLCHQQHPSILSDLHLEPFEVEEDFLDRPWYWQQKNHRRTSSSGSNGNVLKTWSPKSWHTPVRKWRQYFLERTNSGMI